VTELFTYFWLRANRIKMKTHSFEINSVDAFHDLGDYLHNNKIGKDDSVLIKIRAKDPFEFNEKISSIINHPYSFCNFIKTCRRGINGFLNDGTYLYPRDSSIRDFAKQIGESLTTNTRIKISFERIGNEYQYELPLTGTIQEAAGKIEYFFIANSIVPGDSVVLKINENKLSHLTQTLYYVLIGSALKRIGDIYRIPSMSIDLSNNYFEETELENSILPIRLAQQSGINFTLAHS